MLLLGIDIGSSSVKAALVDARSGMALGTAQSPAAEMPIAAPRPGWAEQDPVDWWAHACAAVQAVLRQTQANPADVAAIGLAYQMHGLVTLDAKGDVVRPAIIWCDSRAVATGEAACQALRPDYCFASLLNAPGNFTASKLRWVQQHEPEQYARIRHFCLPGDYLAYRLTGEIATTVPGLSEGILWDFEKNTLAQALLDHYGLDAALVPPRVPTFGIQGRLTPTAAAALGLRAGTPVTYRAGDQPNNALALHALQAGDIAATAGTSGVVYGVVDQLVADPQQRVNSFAHVNHRPDATRIGILLCINGCGIQYRWLREQMFASGNYADMERAAAAIPVGADGLSLLPFGNGAERMLGNRDIGARVAHLNFNRHTRTHLFRAGLEGIAFAFVHGIKLMRGLGLPLSVIRAGNDNLFQSAIFSETLATLANVEIELYATAGAIGAAQAAGVGIGLYGAEENPAKAKRRVTRFEPNPNAEPYQAACQVWEKALQQALDN